MLFRSHDRYFLDRVTNRILELSHGKMYGYDADYTGFLKLKAARAAKDLSQEQLAQLVGVTRQTIGMIEAGNYNPTLNLCIAICKALDRTLDELFWEE